MAEAPTEARPRWEQEEQLQRDVLQPGGGLDGAAFGCEACGHRPPGCGGCVHGPRVKGRWRPEKALRMPELCQIPTFRPSEWEWALGLHRFVERARPYAERYGAMRVVPPPSWQPPVVEPSLKFRTRVQALNELQHRPAGPFGHGRVERRKRKRVEPPEGHDQTHHGDDSGDEREERFGSPYGFPDGPIISPRELQRYSRYFLRWHFRNADNSEPQHLPLSDIEGEFWRIVERHDEDEPVEVIYGADIPTNRAGSSLPLDGSYGSHLWNVQAVPGDDRSLLRHTKGATGISKPWLYFGSALTAFCWHVEDMHFLSVNCLTKGGPKIWYIVPASHAHDFERAMQKHLPGLFEYQPDLLQSLVTMISPQTLQQEGVPVRRVVQERGDYVITFPFAYHGGFNAAANVAEAVNFAPPSWLPFGMGASERYARTGKVPSISNDRLLMALSGAVLDGSAPTGAASAVSEVLKQRVQIEREVRRAALSEPVGGGVQLMGSGRDCPDLEDTCCSICGRDCHLSGIVCGCMPWKPSCGRHVRCKCKAGRRRLFVRNAVSDLEKLVTHVEAVASKEGDSQSSQAVQAPIACEAQSPTPSSNIDVDGAEKLIARGKVPASSDLVAASDAMGPGLGRGLSKRASKSRATAVTSSSRRSGSVIAPPGW